MSVDQIGHYLYWSEILTNNSVIRRLSLGFSSSNSHVTVYTLKTKKYIGKMMMDTAQKCGIMSFWLLQKLDSLPKKSRIYFIYFKMDYIFSKSLTLSM